MLSENRGMMASLIVRIIKSSPPFTAENDGHDIMQVTNFMYFVPGVGKEENGG